MRPPRNSGHAVSQNVLKKVHNHHELPAFEATKWAEGAMMATASIIHIGTDDCHRIAVLEHAGYFVNSCTSFNQLLEALTGIPLPDAVAVSESFDELPVKAVFMARATSTTIPLILFQNASPLISRYDQSDFDLVVPAFANPHKWVVEVQAFLEESRAIRARTEALREESLLLRQRSLKLRKECIATRERSWVERQRSKAERERNRKDKV
jgi:hypothetical protein